MSRLCLTTGIQALNPASLSLLEIAWALMEGLCVPGVTLGSCCCHPVLVLQVWHSDVGRSFAGVFTHCLVLQGRSAVLPVSLLAGLNAHPCDSYSPYLESSSNDNLRLDFTYKPKKNILKTHWKFQREADLKIQISCYALPSLHQQVAGFNTFLKKKAWPILFRAVHLTEQLATAIYLFKSIKWGF